MRVHQLAKELDLTSKELLPHLKKLGVEAKNHMSSLSEDDVERLKNLLNPPSAEKIVEERIKPTIIRRRRKVVEKPPVEEKVEEEKKGEETPLTAEEVTPSKEAVEVTPAEPPIVSSAKPVEKKPAKEEPESKVKIISKKIVLPEEAEEDKQKITKKKRFKKERFSPGKDITKRKFTAISSKDLQEEEVSPGEKAKRYKPSPFRRKKPLSLVKTKKTEITTPKAIKRKIKVLEGITVALLAKRMGIKAGAVIKKLMDLGVMATMNETIDIDAASLAAHEFGYEVESVTIEEEQILLKKEDSPKDLLPRAPIVTVMGHIDHGKTSLLDAIRQSNVIDREAGGITQHIGAYHVELDKGNIVFIDTPGHEAFTTMRARGAKVTDIVVLVIAADDGIMPQTIEAIDHAKAAKVPIIVAINKIDKPNANPEKIRQTLTEYELVPEDWGGDTLYAEISAKQRKGIEELLEIIILQAEMLELQSNPNKPAKGTVIEAKLDKSKGPVATILVQEGTLKGGDIFITGVHYGKTRVLINDAGKMIPQAGPSTPVQVLGLSGVPEAGDTFLVVDEEKKAKQAGLYFQQKQREKGFIESSRVTLEGLYDQIQEGTLRELNVIIKVDVHGTLDALTKSLQELGNEKVKINIIHSSVGAINQSDVMLASASKAIIIGFAVSPDVKAKLAAEQEKVDIRLYNIIYDAISDITNALEGLLAPTLVENLRGRAEVKQIYQISRLGTIAGSMVTEGKITRDCKFRIMRDGTLMHQGRISSLKRFKDDTREVESGYECGIGVEGFEEIQIGDIIECYTTEEVVTKL
ncbi:MAG: translation initiation factor IF-2 [Deltaproteobacteria bacterium]|nr:translation initiation factor IF-2 [Deltaproteobacteria bacterium]